MGDISYKPLIQDMRWSFSRIESFDSCKWKWFLHYIREWEEDDLFYNSYGSLIHEIIQLYYTGKLKKEQMPLYFLKNFSERVSGERPAESTVQKYISAGLNYTRNFKPFDLNCVGVEKKIEFSIDGIQFVGFIDFLGEKDNEFYIIDHKSRELKQRSKKLQKTSKDKELDEMLKQLYLYSAGIKQEFGKYPKKLCFNCFRNSIILSLFCWDKLAISHTPYISAPFSFNLLYLS